MSAESDRAGDSPGGGNESVKLGSAERESLTETLKNVTNVLQSIQKENVKLQAKIAILTSENMEKEKELAKSRERGASGSIGGQGQNSTVLSMGNEQAAKVSWSNVVSGKAQVNRGILKGAEVRQQQFTPETSSTKRKINEDDREWLTEKMKIERALYFEKYRNENIKSFVRIERREIEKAEKSGRCGKVITDVLLWMQQNSIKSTDVKYIDFLPRKYAYIMVRVMFLDPDAIEKLIEKWNGESEKEQADGINFLRSDTIGTQNRESLPARRDKNLYENIKKKEKNEREICENKGKNEVNTAFILKPQLNKPEEEEKKKNDEEKEISHSKEEEKEEKEMIEALEASRTMEEERKKKEEKRKLWWRSKGFMLREIVDPRHDNNDTASSIPDEDGNGTETNGVQMQSRRNANRRCKSYVKGDFNESLLSRDDKKYHQHEEKE